MKLIHYSYAPLEELRFIDQAGDTFKPRGLWVSDDDCPDNWRVWCESENFRPNSLKYRNEITLKLDANVIFLRCAEDIDEFTRNWALHPFSGIRSNQWIDWEMVRASFQGIIATPYIWERRLSYGANDAMWYYSWDCASGCIWDPSAISAITPLEPD